VEKSERRRWAVLNARRRRTLERGKSGPTLTGGEGDYLKGGGRVISIREKNIPKEGIVKKISRSKTPWELRELVHRRGKLVRDERGSKEAAARMILLCSPKKGESPSSRTPSTFILRIWGRESWKAVTSFGCHIKKRELALGKRRVSVTSAIGACYFICEIGRSPGLLTKNWEVRGPVGTRLSGTSVWLTPAGGGPGPQGADDRLLSSES